MGDESNQVATFFLIAVYIISKKQKHTTREKKTENKTKTYIYININDSNKKTVNSYKQNDV